VLTCETERADAGTRPIFAGTDPHRAYALVLLAILVAVTWARVRPLGVPLERDEGEFDYLGALLLEGHAHFADLYTRATSSSSRRSR